MADLPSGNFADMLPDIFANAKWFIAENQVFVMVGTGIAIATALLTIIARLFTRDDDDDDEYDYREI